MLVPDTSFLGYQIACFVRTFSSVTYAVFFIRFLFWCIVSVRCPLLLLCLLHTRQSPCWIRMENTFISKLQLQFYALNP